jgi:hypothetical protein
MRDARWLLAGLIASGVMQAPFTNYAHFSSAVAPGDGRAIAWIVTWVAHALATGQPLFDANMFYPSRGSLAQIDPMPALGVLGAPIWFATGDAMPGLQRPQTCRTRTERVGGRASRLRVDARRGVGVDRGRRIRLLVVHDAA